MAQRKRVFLTGATGFIAKHVLLQLLSEGYLVRASVRSPERAAEVRATMAAHLLEPDDLDRRLQFVTLDLERDAGWDEALAGCSALVHVASPFPIAAPQDEEDLIRPAVDGTLRAIAAAHAAGVHRVILTSSMAAMVGKRLPAGRTRYDASDWSDVHSDRVTAYMRSKTLAERAAWNATREYPELRLTTINPGLVLGPPLDRRIGSSLKLVARLLSGRDPFVPRLGFSIVDVRDVALMHLRALQREESVGHRFIAAERFMWMADMARVLKAEFPGRRIPTREAPDWLMRFMALWDPQIRAVVPQLGTRWPGDNAPAAELLGIEFIDARTAIKTSAAALLREGVVS